ncbi:MAG: diguanylate cyclase, partial [Lachnospiraceae bacterium]|nr:diguanylate cyclase [Lachnospiraceae bacterium]
MTGLESYEVFLNTLQSEIDMIGDDRIAIVYTDIKHFKYINDTYGYKVGDSLLKEFVSEFTHNQKFIFGAARVYSDNFVAASRIT